MEGGEICVLKTRGCQLHSSRSSFDVLAYPLVLSLVPDDTREVRSAWPMLTLLLKRWVAEGVAKQCLYRFEELASMEAEPVGSKGAVGEHTTVSIYNEGPPLLRDTSPVISRCLHTGAQLTWGASGRGWERTPAAAVGCLHFRTVP